MKHFQNNGEFSEALVHTKSALDVYKQFSEYPLKKNKFRLHPKTLKFKWERNKI